MRNIPYEKRYAAKLWQASNGTYKTTHVGNLEMMFPAVVKSKIFAICPDIVTVDKSDGEPMFDLILSIETLAKLGTVLDFKELKIQIDHTGIAMRPYMSLAQILICMSNHPKRKICMYFPVQVLLLGTT